MLAPRRGRDQDHQVPELPDIEVYVEALAARVLGQPLERVRLGSPFLLRSADPPLAEVEGRRVAAVRRLGKRIVLALDGELFLVAAPHDRGPAPLEAARARSSRASVGLAAFDFPTGTLTLTEAGSKRRAALHLVRGEAALARARPRRARAARGRPRGRSRPRSGARTTP